MVMEDRIEGDCKIVIPVQQRRLAPDLSWPEFKTETVWGKRTSSGAATVANIPFFAVGINLYDQVAISAVDTNSDLFSFDRVLSPSGHRTVRAILISATRQAVAEDAIKRIEALGCFWEGGGEVAAIDIPPAVSSAAVMEVLRSAEDEGAIYIDIGSID